MTRFRASILAFAHFMVGVPAHADVAPEDSSETVFKKGVSALRDGAVNDAVDSFEALADRGGLTEGGIGGRGITAM